MRRETVMRGTPENCPGWAESCRFQFAPACDAHALKAVVYCWSLGKCAQSSAVADGQTSIDVHERCPPAIPLPPRPLCNRQFGDLGPEETIELMISAAGGRQPGFGGAGTTTQDVQLCSCLNRSNQSVWARTRANEISGVAETVAHDPRIIKDENSRS
jgi:hypothetical protein